MDKVSGFCSICESWENPAKCKKSGAERPKKKLRVKKSGAERPKKNLRVKNGRKAPKKML